MDYRPLGHTGVSVSQLCLGAMMFGAFSGLRLVLAGRCRL
jgi:aryl-alcohol dehydrogenase-like predicted oxidoreductase